MKTSILSEKREKQKTIFSEINTFHAIPVRLELSRKWSIYLIQNESKPSIRIDYESEKKVERKRFKLERPKKRKFRVRKSETHFFRLIHYAFLGICERNFFLLEKSWMFSVFGDKCLQLSWNIAVISGTFQLFNKQSWVYPCYWHAIQQLSLTLFMINKWTFWSFVWTDKVHQSSSLSFLHFLFTFFSSSLVSNYFYPFFPSLSTLSSFNSKIDKFLLLY